MPQTPPNDPQEISGVLNWVNQLGTATERFFSRLYHGFDQQSKGAQQHAQRRQSLQQKIETARRISEQNKQLKRYLEKRRVEVDRMQGILAALPEGIVMQDLEGRVVFINRAARELLGNQKRFWSSEIGSLFDMYRDITTLETEIVPFGEPERVTVNNRILGAQVAGVANNDGQRLGTMIMLRDVTRDALADRLKDQFATAISHELKTPMTIIKGMSDLLGQSTDHPPDRALLEALTRNVDILDRMVVELLNVAEMSAGTFSIRHDPVRMEPMVWSVVNGIAPEVKKKRLEILVQMRNLDQLNLNGDEQHLRWALGHLLQNAIHYTESGGRIWVSAGIDPKKPDNINLQIRDTGVGITDKDLPHVFDRFYRGKARSRSGRLLDPRGLGQGLFIARTVAEVHRGYLTASSVPGQGSTFTLVLPVA